MYKSCDIYIMEMSESIIWILSGFIPTLITMELGWRLARRQVAKGPIANLL